MTGRLETLTLPEPLDVLLTKMNETHLDVRGLHPLLQLLNEPEQESSDLGQAILTVLGQMSDFLARETELRDRDRRELNRLPERFETLRDELLLAQAQHLMHQEERSARIERKLDRILTALNLPLD